MAPVPKIQETLRSKRSEARAAGALMLGGAGLVALSLVLPHPSGGDTGLLLGVAAAMVATGIGFWLGAGRIPVWGTHVALAATSAAVGVLIYASGVAAGQYGSIFVWTTLVAAYYFRRPAAVAQVAWLLTVYAITLATVESTAGYSPLTRWLFTAISLTVVGVLTSTLVAKRRQTDMRARRFFELSRDMLCTFDRQGNAVELNSSWESCLGYSAAELRAAAPFELIHPNEKARSEAAVSSLFDGIQGIGFENRYRAKDGSWRWLSWSASLSRGEDLIYARATDVTELKRVEDEREQLLEEVGVLARSDALTGLPNRRALEEQLPRELARARRNGSDLCIAILDIDHFKAYNDSHGHLAGDEVLRECASAWDAELRGGDTIVRFGGEEFLVLLPDASLEQAERVVERLRAATTSGQSCSAGLALWDAVEGQEQLLERADAALYAAKAGGRDRLVRS